MISVAVAYNMAQINPGILLCFCEQTGQSNLFICSEILKLLIEKIDRKDSKALKLMRAALCCDYLAQSLGTK